jgi:hypothetical protein
VTNEPPLSRETESTEQPGDTRTYTGRPAELVHGMSSMRLRRMQKFDLLVVLCRTRLV